MALAYLGSWLPSFSSSTTPGPEQPPKQLSEQELHELHQQWVRLQSSHQGASEQILGKLVEENNGLKHRLEVVERELKDVKAGRREDEELLKKATKEIARLGGQSALAVAILDLELDLFSPEIFHHTDGGRYAAEVLHRKLRTSLQLLTPAEQAKTWTFMVFVFWTRNGEFVKALFSQGLISSIAELDDFINGFNRAHPLFQLIVSGTPREMTLQRERALATVFAHNPTCQRLLLGRWALDLPLAEMLSPSRGAEKVVFPRKVLFVEPSDGFYLHPQLRRREPQIVEMQGILRRFPLKTVGGGGGKRTTLEIDYSKPLWQQNPPICLDFHLSPSRCTDERCPFSHSYHIPREVLDALRFEVSRTPCPILIAGKPCVHVESCFFAHACPKGAACQRRGCLFTAPGMHPRYVPPEPLRPSHQQNSVSPQPTQDLPATVDASLPLPPSHDPSKPPSTRSALERLLSASRTSPHALPSPSPTKPSPHPRSPPKTSTRSPQPPLPWSSPKHASVNAKHSIPLASPFGHPLSVADALEAVAQGHATADEALPSSMSMAHLSDEELRVLLEKARREEEEYERGIGEDPFAARGGSGWGTLKRMGYSCDIAEDGFVAAEKAQKKPYDLILMDLNMPNMGGLHLTRELRRILSDSPERPSIVCLTANAMADDRARCLEAGADGYVSKPILVPALVEALNDSGVRRTASLNATGGIPPPISDFTLELPTSRLGRGSRKNSSSGRSSRGTRSGPSSPSPEPKSDPVASTGGGGEKTSTSRTPAPTAAPAVPATPSITAPSSTSSATPGEGPAEPSSKA